MTFAEIHHNQKLVEKLRQIAVGSQVHHGYILEGPLSVDKAQIAKSFAQALLCQVLPGEGCGTCDICVKIETENHIDLTFIRASKADTSKVYSIKDGDIESLIHRLQKKPFEGQRNIGIVESVETITPRAANRLLKTLEEPPVGTVIILLCENINVLPRTIVSRCVLERVQEHENGFSEETMEQARELVYLMIEKAPFYKTKRLIEKLNQEKAQMIMYLECLEIIYGDLMRGKGAKSELFRKEYVFNAIEAIETAKNDIKNNIGVRYVMMNLILRIGG
jgi:DNA polymerase III subunit delta'